MLAILYTIPFANCLTAIPHNNKKGISTQWSIKLWTESHSYLSCRIK